MTLRDDDVLQEIGRALAVEPSDGFAHGVRRRIARRRVVARTAAWSLAIAAGVVLAVVIQRPDRPVSPEVIQAVVPVTPVTRPATKNDDVPPPARRREAPIVPAVPPAQPEVVVVTNQLDVLRALWAGYDAGGVVRAEESQGAEPAVAQGIEERPIAIEPVRVLPVVIAADDRRPVEPLPIIRRVFAATDAR